MREIKFRYWDHTQVEYHLIDQFSSKIDFWTCYYYHVSKHNTTLEQFTGLKDKNGVEIYEGDIVEFNAGSESGTAVVEPIFNTCNLAFWWKKQITEKPTMFSECNYFGCADELEVIGNIHQNPELLK